MSASAPSATPRVPAFGVMTTGMPRRVAAARSTRSTPTPLRPMTRSAVAASITAASIVAAARATMPTACGSHRPMAFGVAGVDLDEPPCADSRLRTRSSTVPMARIIELLP